MREVAVVVLPPYFKQFLMGFRGQVIKVVWATVKGCRFLLQSLDYLEFPVRHKIPFPGYIILSTQATFLTRAILKSDSSLGYALGDLVTTLLGLFWGK